MESPGGLNIEPVLMNLDDGGEIPNLDAIKRIGDA